MSNNTNDKTMLMKRKLIGLAVLLSFVGCSNKDKVDLGIWNPYRNPVEQADVQDPSVYVLDGNFYIFATGTSESVLPLMVSSDLTGWELATSVFDDTTVPMFIEGVMPQSPEIARVGDKYLLYYTMYATPQNCGIGVAAADLVTGPYTDCGKLVLASEIGLDGVASPSFVKDGERCYLVFGNFDGIYLVELSEDGRSLASGAVPVKIASELFDAPQIFVKDGQYYLFASVGSSEGGAASSCCQVVGRSDGIDGPYLDKELDSMLEDGYEILISGSTKFAGPGHGCIFNAPDGNTWMLYNAYDLSDVDKGRTLMLDCVNWQDGWPNVRGAIGSFCADAPVLNN